MASMGKVVVPVEIVLSWESAKLEEGYEVVLETVAGSLAGLYGGDTLDHLEQAESVLESIWRMP